MKKISKIMAVVMSMLMLFGTGTALATEYENIIDVQLDEIDATNSTGISTWSAVPLVTAQNLADGYTGGEGCQHMNSVMRDTIDGNLIFLGTDVGGLFRSFDAGDTWEPCNRGFHTRGVSRVAIDPINKAHVVAMNCAGSALKYNGLYYSFDTGDNWRRSANTQPGYRGGYFYYDCIEFDPGSYDEALGYCTDVYWSTPYERDGATLMTEDAAGLYRSKDGGITFEKLESEQKLFDGIILISDGLVKLANQYGIFVQRQADGEFSQVYDSAVKSFLYVNDIYYVMTDDGIYTSSDLESYVKKESTNFPVDRDAAGLDVSSINPNHMVMSAKKSAIKYSERPFYSYDGGITWAQGDISDRSGLFYYYTYHTNSYTFNPFKAGEVVATQGGVAIKSTDWGKTWKSSNTGINNVMCGGKFNFNIYDNNLIYVGAQDFGGALTKDGGRTWENVSLSKDNDGKNIYGGYAADENTLFGVYTEQWGNSTLRAQQRFVCFSHDGGKTVNITKTQLEEDAAQFESIRICEKIKGSWESSYQSPTDRNILFCANFRSTDNGYTWVNMLNTEGDTKCLQVYTHSGTVLYGACDASGYVVKSDDNGATWTKVNTQVLPGTDYHIADIAVDGKNGYIYAAFSGKLYRMNLDGSNVTDLSTHMSKDNMGARRTITVTVDPNHPEIVYCGNSGDYYQSTCGVRRSCDSGETWYTVTCSTASDCIVKDGKTFGYESKCLRVNPATGEVWNGTSCLGFNKLSPPYENSITQQQEDITVTFDYCFNNTAARLITKYNRIVNEIEQPVRTDFDFSGWFTDKEYADAYQFGTRQTGSVTLYAKWQLRPDHVHTLVTDSAVEATCVSTGLTEGTHCSVCSAVITAQSVTAVTAHNDADGNGYCDYCNKDMGTPKTCSHLCHNSSLGFLWKIINFFYKIFGMNQYCSCGERHW